MKICVIGVGSMGQRHIRNISEMLAEREEPLELHVLRHGHSSLPENICRLIKTELHSYDRLDNDYDAIFVTNPTSLHYETLCSVEKKAKSIFVEKPVFDSLDYDFEKFMNNDKIYVACPLRYMNVVQQLKEIVLTEKVFSCRVICSSYLPDWRPGVDYRNTYAAHKGWGGGVETDLIHEWDYITELFGIPQKVKYIAGKYSDLEIETNDLALYIAEYKDKLLSLQLDYFGRVPKREVELFTENDTIVADLIQGNIRWLKDDKCFNLKEERDAYQKHELELFFDIFEGKEKNSNTVARAIETLRLTKGEI